MLEIKNLCYIYNFKTKKPIVAVNNINFSVDNSEIVGIVGATGSGKSTLAKILGGLLSPTSGQVIFDGKNIYTDFKKMRDVYLKIGMSFQYPENQLFGKTVFDDIVFAAKNYGLTKNLNSIAETAANFVGLDVNLLSRHFLTLSGGEKRKCAIASVIATNPQILILDEPTAGLDAKSKHELISSIKNYHKQKKNIVIVISHVMEEVVQLCDKVLVIHSGKQVYYDTPSQIFKNEEKLEQIGLEAPQAKKIITLINNRGYSSNENIITANQVVEEIIKLLK